jgi:protein-disulfide isomerase
MSPISARRVYYTAVREGGSVRRVAALMMIAVAWSALPAAAQGPPAGNPFTVNPVMARGPADAPVTIVEFSDYQ